jgi:AP-2 complex subunit mu-1
VFKSAVINSSDSNSSSNAPIRFINDESYLYIRHQDMYVVAISKKNTNAGMSHPIYNSWSHVASFHRIHPIWLFALVLFCVAVMAFQFLYQLLEVFKAYFGNSFDEEALRDNFVLVYELFDGTSSLYFFVSTILSRSTFHCLLFPYLLSV